ncbi:MAG: ImmA/IrrE family metallo-endopeptidase [Deltaproteobacteria bacterium]|jgi:Zn-dependent peptidase ImmA (M78 family)|nr:ImmA/IrrE family metallo-endopeptidase [Deltaproteobacteria bacterium]
MNALINKDALNFIFEHYNVSNDYIISNSNITLKEITEWRDESNEIYPPILKAEKLANLLRISFATLYLDIDYLINNKNLLKKYINKRVLYGISSTDDSLINLLIKDLLESKDLYYKFASDLDSDIIRFNINIDFTNYTDLAKSIRDIFNISLTDQFKFNSSRKFYLYIRNRIEDKGIFVQCFKPNIILKSKKISNRYISPRGIAIYDSITPIIGINSSDNYEAKIFTIFHELVHILKNNTAICFDLALNNYDNKEEVFCNKVAAEVLVPRDYFNSLLNNNNNNNTIDLNFIEKLAQKFSVSLSVINRRLLDLNYISDKDYINFNNIININYLKKREDLKNKNNDDKHISRDIPREIFDFNSYKLSNNIISCLNNGFLSRLDISIILNFKYQHVDKYINLI